MDIIHELVTRHTRVYSRWFLYQTLIEITITDTITDDTRQVYRPAPFKYALTRV